MIMPKSRIILVSVSLLSMLLSCSPNGGEDTYTQPGEVITKKYTVIYSLFHTVSSNMATSVSAGDSYSSLITAEEGYTLGKVSCTMGGKPQTVTDGSINIPEVTGTILISAVATNGYAGTEVSTLTKSDALKAFENFNKYFWNPTAGRFFRNTGNTTNYAVAWVQATYFDMIMNAYKLSGDNKYLEQLKAHFKGCKNSFGFDWYNYDKWNLYDDMMWWVGALARAYNLTGDAEYLTLSENGFHRVWYGKSVEDGGDARDAKGSYGGDTGGGMYWDWKFGRKGKMACINFPTVIAALELYKATGKQDYLNKAKSIYDWAIAHLFNATTGKVADSTHDNGDVDWTAHIYNQATCMGACAMMYLATKDQAALSNAKLALSFIVNKKTGAGGCIIGEGDANQTAVTDEMGIYNAILAQYLPVLFRDCGAPDNSATIKKSIEAGWAAKDTRGLCNKDFITALDATKTVSSYTASGLPALMLTYPGMHD